MKEWKQVFARVVQLIFFAIQLIGCVMLSLLLLNIPCRLCGYKHIFHVILPEKIQGLYGIKLDKPFVDKNAVREGDHYNVSCEGKPCKSIQVYVVEKSGEPYVERIEIVSTLSFGEVISLLTEKYGEANVSDERCCIFMDWRSWNWIGVHESRPSDISCDSTTDIPFVKYGSSDKWSPSSRFQGEVRITAFGKLSHQKSEAEEDAKKEARKREIDAL